MRMPKTAPYSSLTSFMKVTLTNKTEQPARKVHGSAPKRPMIVNRGTPEHSMTRYDAIVIGGGLVGSAVAYGLGRKGLRPALIDEGDVAYRASRGNFGLVWVQSKGDGAPDYQRWTRRSADEWPALAQELLTKTGIAVGHERPGGVHLCLDEAELAARRAMMERMRTQSGNFGFDYRMLDRH